MLRLIIRIAPSTRRLPSTDGLRPIEALGDILKDIQDDNVAGLPRHARSWEAMRGAMRDRLQLLRVVIAQSKADKDFSAFEQATNEARVVEAMWSETEQETNQGALYPKLKHALDREIDLLTRGAVTFNIADMVATSVAHTATGGAVPAGTKRARGTSLADIDNQGAGRTSGAGGDAPTQRARRQARAERLREANRDGAGGANRGAQQAA